MMEEKNREETANSPQGMVAPVKPLPIVSKINLDRFSLSDPTDKAGTQLSTFSFYRLDEFALTPDEAGRVIDKLYERVYNRIKSLERIPGIEIKVTDFADYASKGDVRRYITAHRKTGRKASATMFVRFIKFDNQLYLSVDSYVLGKINWLLLALKSVPLLLTLLNILSFLSSILTPFGANWLFAFLYIIGAFFWGFIATPLWLKVFMRCFKSKDLETTIRQEFSGKLDTGSFTDDDISSFLRTSFKMAITSIRDVFSEEKLPFEEIEKFVQNINNSYVNVTAGHGVNISNGSSIGVGNSTNVKN